MRTDLLLSDKWQTSDQACTSAKKGTLTRLKKALKSSMQDFGIADLQKAVKRVGIGNEGNVTVPECNFSNQINCVEYRVCVCVGTFTFPGDSHYTNLFCTMMWTFITTKSLYLAACCEHKNCP